MTCTGMFSAPARLIVASNLKAEKCSFCAELMQEMMVLYSTKKSLSKLPSINFRGRPKISCVAELAYKTSPFALTNNTKVASKSSTSSDDVFVDSLIWFDLPFAFAIVEPSIFY